MTIALSLSILLLGTPVQSVEDSSEVQQLRKQVEVLESRIAEHEAKTESFTDILSSQRWTFGAAITFITVLVTVLFGLVGWSIFEWRADYIESDLRDKVEDESSARSDEVERLEKRIEKLESSFEEIEHWRKGEDIRRFRQLGYYPMSLLLQARLINEDVTKRGLTESEKVDKEIEALEYDLSKVKEINSDFPDGMRAEIISELSSISDKVSGKTEENLKSVLETMKEDF
jgi:chaperonin cofactor prefoldin